jgi:signal transduction histidine kinase
MRRTIVARMLRALLVACGVAILLVLAVDGGGAVLPGPLTLPLPFVAVAVAALGLGVVLPRLDRVVARVTHHRDVTPYSALAAAAARIGAGSLEEALPGLAQVLADGTGARRAVVWLAVGDRLVSAAVYPADDAEAEPQSIPNLATLLARPDIHHVVPVLDGTSLRAVLAIEKPNAPIAPDDQRLVQDVANGATLLLRGVALNAELAERVRRADVLAAELASSRQRLARAREVERKRLVIELGHATTDRLAALRTDVTAARASLDASTEEAEAAQRLARASADLDELLDRFRVLARGVYPAVLRDQGPMAALDEVAADLTRPVRLTGGLRGRLDYEIESGVYYACAAAMAALAGWAGEGELHVHLERGGGRVSVRVDDPAPAASPDELRAALADDAERLAALGGELDVVGSDRAGGPLTVRAWLPDRLEPVVEPTLGVLGTEVGAR